MPNYSQTIKNNIKKKKDFIDKLVKWGIFLRRPEGQELDAVGVVAGALIVFPIVLIWMIMNHGL